MYVCCFLCWSVLCRYRPYYEPISCQKTPIKIHSSTSYFRIRLYTRDACAKNNLILPLRIRAVWYIVRRKLFLFEVRDLILNYKFGWWKIWERYCKLHSMERIQLATELDYSISFTTDATVTQPWISLLCLTKGRWAWN